MSPSTSRSADSTRWRRPRTVPGVHRRWPAEPSRAPRIEATHTGLLILSATTSLMILFRGMNLLFVFRSAAWQAELSPRQDILQAYQVAQMMAFLPIFFVPTMAIVAALAISMLSVFETAGAAVLLSFLFLNMMAP